MYSVYEPNEEIVYFNDCGDEIEYALQASKLQIQRFNKVLRQLTKTWNLTKNKLAIVAVYSNDGTNDIMKYIYRLFISVHKNDINYYNTKNMNLAYKHKKLNKIKNSIHPL
jgi:hypothetical protein